MQRLHAVLVSTVLGLWESKWESGIKPGSVSSSLAHPQPLCLNAEKDAGRSHCSLQLPRGKVQRRGRQALPTFTQWEDKGKWARLGTQEIPTHSFSIRKMARH